MAKFIRHPRWVEEVSYHLLYEYIDTPGAGFSFPCTAEGKALPMDPAAKVAYRKCVDGTIERAVVPRGISKHVSRYKLPGATECNTCTAEVNLTDVMTNECECGTFYNGSGQQLCAPSLWGEETGERFDANGQFVY